MNPKEIFKTVTTILVIDWPSREVPELLARAGFHVIVHGGPGPEDYSAYELNGDEVIARHVDRPPQRADLVYSYRPLSELPQIIATAETLNAKTIWTQSGLSSVGEKDPKGCWVPKDELRLARAVHEISALSMNHLTGGPQPRTRESVFA